MKKYLKIALCALVLFMAVGCGKATVEENDALVEFVETNRSSVTTLSNDMLTADLLARDGSLVYSFKYTETFPEANVELMKKSLDESLKNNEKTYTDVLDSIRLVAPKTKSVIVEYLNGDGTLISSKEYTK